ncbi:MAG: helix-turn-helix domain-containing protein [Methylococcaceae bacterium]
MIEKFTGCNDCCMSNLCLISTLNRQEATVFEKMVNINHIYRRGEHFGRHNEFLPIFGILKVGSSRTELISHAGERQVVSFNFPGDLLRLNLLTGGESNLVTSVVFLETSIICTIPFDSFHYLIDTLPTLRQELVLRLSNEVARHQQLIMAVNNFSGEELVAMLLLDLSNYLSARGMEKKYLRLNMPRDDIANYLGLVSATVSRILTKFELAGLIDVKGKNIHLKDFQRLENLMHRPKIERKSLLSDRRDTQQSFFQAERREYAQSFA